MAMMAPRESWTDERLDDLAKGVGEVRAEVRELRTEMGHVREELGKLRAEIKGLRETMDAKFGAVDANFAAIDNRFDDVMRTMQIGFGLIGVVLAALVGMVATQL
jgi:predicted  nucleic acid-binding Zn-ribbon protein